MVVKVKGLDRLQIKLKNSRKLLKHLSKPLWSKARRTSST